MQLAVDMHEMFERVSLSLHGSFMPHAAIYKIMQSILEVGDVEAFDTSPLEMQNAETKRKARSTVAPPTVPRFPRACRSVDRARKRDRRGSIQLQQEQQRQQPPP